MHLVNTSPTFRLDVGSASVEVVTVDVTRADGTLLVDGGATTDNDDGTYDYTLSVGDNDQVDLLKLEWTVADTSEIFVSYEEIAGSLLFTLDQARAFNAKADASAANKPLASDTEYPDDIIADERVRVTNDLEYWTGRSWVSRYCRAEFRGSGSSVLDLNAGRPRTSDGYQLHRPGRLSDVAEILSVTVGGTVVDVDTLDVDGSKLVFTNGGVFQTSETGGFNVTVEWVYGLPTPVDGVDRIGLKLLVDRLVPSAFPDRLITADTEYGTVRYVQPGGPMGNVARIPEVNDWVHRHDHRVFLG